MKNKSLNIYDHQAFICQCGCVSFNLQRSGQIECTNCGFIQNGTHTIGSKSSIILENDPIKEILDICKTYNKKCTISFVIGLYEKEKGYAVTIFHEKLDSTPEIFIDVDVPYYHVIELIAHEFAHVVVGKKENHSKKWKKIFEEINQKFNNLQVQNEQMG